MSGTDFESAFDAAVEELARRFEHAFDEQGELL